MRFIDAFAPLQRGERPFRKDHKNSTIEKLLGEFFHIFMSSFSQNISGFSRGFYQSREAPESFFLGL
jgi:hypothetical protein